MADYFELSGEPEWREWALAQLKALGVDAETFLWTESSQQRKSIGLPLLALQSALSLQDYATLLRNPRLRSVLIPGGDPDWAAYTLKWGASLASWPELPVEEARVFERTLAHTESRFEVLHEVDAWLLTAKVRERVRTGLLELIEELLTNALYDAPVSDTGLRLYAQASRNTHFQIPLRQRPRLVLSLQGRILWGEVIDPFGSLQLKQLRLHLADGLEGKLSEKSGGAGIGLARVLTRANWLGVRVHPGKSTQIRFGVGLDKLPSGSPLTSNCCLIG